MASKSQSGRGTVFSIGAITGTTQQGSTESFTKVGEVTQCSPSGATFDLEDVSNFDSGVLKEKLGTMADGGTVDVKYNYIAGKTDAGQVALGAAFDGLPRDFTIVLPPNKRLSPPQTAQGDTVSFSAIVTKVGGMEITTKNAVTSSCSLSVVSTPVITPGN